MHSRQNMLYLYANTLFSFQQSGATNNVILLLWLLFSNHEENKL